MSDDTPASLKKAILRYAEQLEASCDLSYRPPVGITCPICNGADLGCIWGMTPEEARRDRDGWK